MDDAGKTFRALHAQPGAFVMPNPWDVGSARILAALGFKALGTTSTGMAHARGQPDGTVSRDATLAHCRALVAATPLPLSADLEKGFGDAPEIVFETVTAAADCGLAGCSIEDHTGRVNEPIYDLPLAVERIEAAVEAGRRAAKDFVLTARCETLLWGRPDLAVVVNRLQAYDAAGADVLYAPGLRDLGAICEVCASVAKPVNVVMETPATAFSVDALAEAGVKRISTGSALALLAYGSLIRAARDVAEGRTFGFLKDVTDFAEVDAFFKRSADP